MSTSSAFDNASNSAGSEYPVASKVSWAPAARGGSNFRSHRLDVSARVIAVKITPAQKLFGYMFLALGIVAIAVTGIPGLR